MNEFLPALNSSGTYKFKKPFSDFINSQTVYQCKSIRKISELISSGVDVFNTYYSPYNIQTVMYEEDKNNDISIIGLYNDTAKWLYVPTTFINSYPDNSGVPYRRIAYAIDIGPIEESFDLSVLNESLSNLVKTNLGIVPDIRIVSLSKPSMVKYDDHIAIKNMRLGKVEVESTLYVELATYKQQLETARAKIKMLEKYISDNFNN